MEATTLKVETKHLTLVPISQILLGTRVSFVKISLHIIQWLSTHSYQEQHLFGINTFNKNEIETLKTIKDIKEALELFETAAIKQGEAISNGNSKIANHNYDKMAIVIKFLRTHKSLHELSKFYTHNNISVRL